MIHFCGFDGSRLQSNENSFSEFRFREPVLTLRAVLIKDLLTTPPGSAAAAAAAATGSHSPSLLIDTLLHTSRLARQHGNYQVAGRCLSQLMTLDLNAQFKSQCRLEKALTEWHRKDRSHSFQFQYISIKLN